MLDRGVLDPATGCVDLDAWQLRVRAHIGVGRCRCGFSLMPGEPDVDQLPNRRITWLPVECAGCGASSTLIAERPVRSPARA
jgi:hypothetical protein